jgi:tetratricopeptide (TPR) repeat protein
MTMTLTHPPAEDLGCFIEGTLDDQARAAVVEHLADCDDCRITVVDAVEFAEPAAFDEKVAVKQSSAGGRWWMAAAAAIAIAIGAMWFVDSRHDPRAKMIEASTHLNARLIAARLSGFGYLAPKSRLRGASGSTDPAALEVELAADDVLNRGGNDARMQNAKGVAQLLYYEAQLAERDADTTDEGRAERQKLVDQRNAAIPMLASAAKGAPDKAAYLSDLAVALIAKGDRQSLQKAVDVCNHALSIDSNSADALFNRAKARELMAQTQAEQTEAINAYKSYLKVDPSSPWAKEARERVKTLNDDLLPP